MPDGTACSYISDDMSNLRKHLTIHCGGKLPEMTKEWCSGGDGPELTRARVVLAILKSGLPYNQFVDDGELAKCLKSEYHISMSGKTFRADALKLRRLCLDEKRKIIRSASTWVAVSFDTSSKWTITSRAFAAVVVHLVDDEGTYREVSLGCIEYERKSDAAGVRGFLEDMFREYDLMLGIRKGCEVPVASGLSKTCSHSGDIRA